MKILVTGVAGFIGMAVAKALLERGDEVVGIDNLNDYYDVQLKHDRLKLINDFDAFTFETNESSGQMGPRLPEPSPAVIETEPASRRAVVIHRGRDTQEVSFAE